MASLPMDQAERRSSGSGKPPVSAHPAFPAIVALWFAALLGVGTLIVPVQLIEQIIAATGISSVISSAAPPLGFTARAAIALVATIFGAVLGLVAARRLIARGKDTGAIAYADTDTYADDAARNFDDDLLDDDLPPLGRRRPLTIAEDETRSDFLDVAPLPGPNAGYDDEDDALELSEPIHGEDEPNEFEDESVVEGEFEDVVGQENMPAGAIPQSIDELIEADASESENVAEAPLEIETVAQDQSGGASAAAKPLPFSPPSLARQPEAAPFDAPAAENLEDDSFAEQADAPAPHEQTTHEVSVPDTPTFESGDVANQDAPAPFAEPASDKVAEVEPQSENGEGLVQLVQKLGSTLEKHREWTAQRAVAAEAEAAAKAEAEALAAAKAEVEETPAPAPEPVAESIAPEFAAAAPDEAAEAMAAYFGKPADSAPAVEAPKESPAQAEEEVAATEQPAPGTSYQPFAGIGHLAVVEDDDDLEDDEHDIAASFTLPSIDKFQDNAEDQGPSERPAFDVPPADAAPQAEAVEEEAEPETAASVEETHAERDASYRSISEMDNPFKQPAEEFVRVEEPEPEAGSTEPAVLFPNQQPHRPVAEVPAQDAPASGPRTFDPPTSRPDFGAAPAQNAAPVPAPEARNPASHEDNEQALRAALMNLQRMAK